MRRKLKVGWIISPIYSRGNTIHPMATTLKLTNFSYPELYILLVRRSRGGHFYNDFFYHSMDFGGRVWHIMNEMT